MPVPTISSQQQLQFDQERNNASQQLLTQQAGTQYQQELQQQAFKNDLGKFNIDWGRKRQNIPGGFIQRGVLDSGMYHQALQDYANDRLMGLNDLAIRNQLGQTGYTMQGRGFEDEFARSMMGSYNREYATKADIAAALRGIL